MSMESAAGNIPENKDDRRSDLETAKATVQELVERSRFFSQETKDAIMRAVEVDIDDFTSEVLDRSNSDEYRSRSGRGQAYFYLSERIKREVFVVEQDEKEELFNLLQWIERVRA